MAGGRSGGMLPRLVAALMAGTAVALLPNVPAVAQSQASAAATLNIPAQSLARALIAFSRQTKIEVFVPSNVAAGKRSSAVSGPMSADAALQQLLSGTGLTYSFNGSTFSVSDPNAGGSNAGATVEGAIALDTIDVTGAGAGGAQPGEPYTPDTPYATPGSVSHISQEQLDRVPTTSPADIFRNTPGVISVGSRVGASIQPNIRGLSGNGRVKVTVDGSEQTSSNYRGYAGTRDETYIDPDFVGGVDITKGPDAAGGGFGGTVAFRTLSVGDLIVDPAKNWGVRVRGSLGNNSGPPSPEGTTETAARPSFFDGDTWQGSIAGAATFEHFDIIAAYSRRNQGNYFAGTRATEGVVFPPGAGDRPKNTTVPKGGEVFNTSEDTQSFMLKGTGRWGDGHSLELGYRLYDSTQGEIYELDISTGTDRQRPPSAIRVDNYTAKYRWQPSGNNLVNLRANLYYTDLDYDRYSNGWAGGDHRNHTTGGDVGNRALIDFGSRTLTIDSGLSFTYEDAEAAIASVGTVARPRFSTIGPTGTRLKWSGHLSAKLDATDWLELSAEARYDAHRSVGKGLADGLDDNTGSRLNPGFGVTLKPVDGLQFFATYKEGYRAPSLRESHWIGDNAVFNPDLKSEISRNWEFGANILRDGVFIAGDSLRFKAVWFDNHYEDYIYRAGSLIGVLEPLRYSNVDRANFEGFELSGAYDAGPWFLEGAFTKYANIEYCPADGPCFVPAMGGMFGSGGPFGADFMTGYVPPEWSGSLTAGVRMFDRRLTLGGRATFAGTRYGTKWGEQRTSAAVIGQNITWPEFVIYDAFGSYKFNDNAELNFSVENIADQYYFDPMTSSGVPSPGRTGRASLTLRF